MADKSRDVIEALENEWRDALCKRDMERLRALVHPDTTSTWEVVAAIATCISAAAASSIVRNRKRPSASGSKRLEPVCWTTAGLPLAR